MPAPRHAADLDRLLADPPREFAVLHRPRSTGPDTLEVLVGDVTRLSRLDELDLPAAPPRARPSPTAETLVLLPFRQIAERGYACLDDGAPILAMTVREEGRIDRGEALARIPDLPVAVEDPRFDVDDDSYERIVRDVLGHEIGGGEGANFVIRRDFTAVLPGFSAAEALAVFRRLMLAERGAYWTFLVHTRSHTFIGATPERHVSLDGGVAVMNPISGTYRHPASEAHLPGLLEFLADRKEADELFMVVDEELKMMARLCDGGVRLRGPYLRPMSRLTHTEYLIEGRTAAPVSEILRGTAFAPTVTGSPLENACRVISRHERTPRGYYSGVIGLIGRDPGGTRTLDSAILIRTAVVDRRGNLRLGVGATLVRLSDAAAEVAETRAKAAGLLGALGLSGTGGPEPAGPPAPGPRDARATVRPDPRDDVRIRAALRRRNETLAGFWLEPRAQRAAVVPQLAGRPGLVIDAEDTFTAMLAHQLRALGADIRVEPYSAAPDGDAADFVVVGPGPGDPTSADDPKIVRLRALVTRLLAERRPFLAVCLGHQVLASVLGLRLLRRPVPHQGTQVRIDLFGRPELVGFYNSFVAHSPDDVVVPVTSGSVEVARDAATGHVHALRSARFASTQFHPESVLTQHGPAILADLLTPLLPPRADLLAVHGGRR